MPNPTKAFILAAGLGTRLRPYTDHCPKPMVQIAGKSILQRSIEKLVAAGVDTIVVNVHYMADILKAHLDTIDSVKIIVSEEDVLLNTGGGVKKALNLFEGQPFYIINGDALWDDAPNRPSLTVMGDMWDEARMDILLMLQPRAQMPDGFSGDYDYAASGHAQRNFQKDGAYMFAGIRIATPRIFEGTPEGAFSFLDLMDKAQQKERLFGYIHPSAWYHISTPHDLETVDALFREMGDG